MSGQDRKISGNDQSRGKPNDLLSRKLLTRNVVVNLLGNVAPFFIAIVSIPIIVDGLGTATFGALLLGWAVIGYFGLLDMGIGRALTQFVSARHTDDQKHQIPQVCWAGLSLVSLIGVAGGGTFYLATPAISEWLVGELAIDKVEAIRALHYVALGIPLTTIATAFRGILAGYQKFVFISGIRSLVGVITFGSPVIVLAYSSSLPDFLAVLVVTRGLTILAYAHYAGRIVPHLWGAVGLHFQTMKELIKAGSWMALSSVVGPILIYMDRFILAAILSAAAVTYYVTPLEIVGRATIIASSFAAVLFPAFALSSVVSPDTNPRFLERSLRIAAVVMLLIVVPIISFADEGLQMWLGAEFAAISSDLLRILAVGLFFNGIAAVPFAYVQGVGRADFTGKLHVAELVFYLPLAVVLAMKLGLVGAALGWTLRVVFDFLALTWFSGKLCGQRMVFRVIVIPSLLLIPPIIVEYLFSNSGMLEIIVPAAYYVIVVAVAFRYLLASDLRQLFFSRSGHPPAPTFPGGNP